jgi:hypothetical protein
MFKITQYTTSKLGDATKTPHFSPHNFSEGPISIGDNLVRLPKVMLVELYEREEGCWTPKGLPPIMSAYTDTFIFNNTPPVTHFLLAMVHTQNGFLIFI